MVARARVAVYVHVEDTMLGGGVVTQPRPVCLRVPARDRTIAARRPDGPAALMFNCPGCGELHAPLIAGAAGRPIWTWNGDVVRPTLSPSVRVRWAYGDKREPRVCHSFVRDGQIQFLSDCTHALAGQTVPLSPWRRSSMSEPANAINVYTCDECKWKAVTRNRDEGTTPFMIGCEARGCDGICTSAFYVVPDGSVPTHEWYRPTSAGERKALSDPDTAEHCRLGGMLLRKVV